MQRGHCHRYGARQHHEHVLQPIPGPEALVGSISNGRSNVANGCFLHTAAARSFPTESDVPRWLRRLHLSSAPRPWQMARSRVAAVTWTGRRITLAYGAGGRRWKASHIVTGTRPLGQGGGLARPAECTARPSAHAVRTVSVAKTAVAHSLPGERSSVAASRLKRRVSLLRG